MSQGKQYQIVILTDSTSWINPTVEALTLLWMEMGHGVIRAHDPNYLPKANFCFCLSFSKILNKDVLALFDHTLVVHASDLPSGKGWSPLTWQILEGKSRIPVCLFEADEFLDSGGIYAKRYLDFEGYELVDDLREKLAATTYELCRWFVSEYPRSASQPEFQEGAESFYPRRGPEDSRMDVTKTIAEQFNLLRVVDNQAYPAFFEYKGRRFTLTITDNGNVSSAGNN